MNYPHQEILEKTANKLIQHCLKQDLKASILSDSYREFSVKLSIANKVKSCGNCILYYSPKRKEFTIGTQELKDVSIEPFLKSFLSPNGEKKEDTIDSSTELNLLPATSENVYSVYVDGSYDKKKTSYAAVILLNNKILKELYGLMQKEEVLGTRQVAGELEAVIQAVDWCEKHSINTVTIYYDYEGIEKWVTGKWKTNHPITISYKNKIRESKVKIQWVKVKSHSGNKFNDYVDLLAKKAISL